MSGETEDAVSGWTVDTMKALFETERRSDLRFHDERDRRYTEVAQEREKALKIKETADETARVLAREIQDYKDEKANNLREQIISDRGMYATKDDVQAAVREIHATMKPLADFVSAQAGRKEGIGFSTGILLAALALATVVVSIVAFVKP